MMAISGGGGHPLVHGDGEGQVEGSHKWAGRNCREYKTPRAAAVVLWKDGVHSLK